MALAVATLLATWVLVRHRRADIKRATVAVQDTAPGPEALRWHLATLACGKPMHRNAQNEMVCPVCPPDSDFAGQPLTPGNDSDTPWTVDGLVFGHFTRADANEAVLKSRGCESHANGFGGNFLLRQEESQWRRVRYIQAGQIDNSCQLLRWIGGRDALVCQTGDMHQGLAFVGVGLYLVDPVPAELAEAIGTEFLGASDDEGACLDAQTPQWLQSATIDAVDVLPRPDGRQDVAVRASLGRVRGKADHNEQCPTAPRLPYRVVFRNDGDHFTAVKGTQALHALQQMDCCRVDVGDTVRPYHY